MCTYPSRAIIRCHADSCPPSPPEVKQCIFRWYLSCPSVVRIVGVFYQRRSPGTSLIKYAHNTYNRRTWKIPSEDTLFYFRKRRRTTVRVTANDGAWWVRANTLWLMTEWPELEMLLIVVVPGLAKSLSWELALFYNWRLTYTLTTTKSDRIGLSSI